MCWPGECGGGGPFAGRAVPASGHQVRCTAADVALALVALAALLRWRVPPWAVVVATALANGLGAAGLAAEFDMKIGPGAYL